jgi:hypothetical protein
LTDGITRHDQRGVDCINDAEAIEKATTIAKEVLATGGKNMPPDMYISVVLHEQEVSRVPIPLDV